MHLKNVLRGCLQYSLLAAFLMALLVSRADAADKPSIWVLLEPKKFGFSGEDIFRRIDENNDGKIDESELRLHKMALFAERDTSKDDNLDKVELGRVKPGVFEELDANRNGKISGYEFNQSTFAKLSTMDADKNGTTSLDEFKAYLKTIRTP
jgi:EF-hand domain pair